MLILPPTMAFQMCPRRVLLPLAKAAPRRASFSCSPSPEWWSRNQVQQGGGRRMSTALLSTSAPAASPFPSRVRIVEVGPRDGLQNEKKVISVKDKVREAFCKIDALVRKMFFRHCLFTR